MCTREPRRLAGGGRLALVVGLLAFAAQVSAAGQLERYGVGRAPSEAEIAAWDLTIPPDGEGLPAGTGTVAEGRRLYLERCASCHGDDGKDPKYYVLVGGRGTLATAKPVPTVGNFWQHATTLWSYIRRAKPLDEPGTFDTNQVYAVTAFLLYMNDIIEESEQLTAEKLIAIRMPNRDGYVPDPRPDVTTVSSSSQ